MSNLNEQPPLSEYLVISRGKWDKNMSETEIEAAIAKFYAWYSGNVETGRFKPGSRLTTDGMVVSKAGVITDGPYGETKEIVGGYWIINARSLREAAEIITLNPCLTSGLFFEIRPLDRTRASAYERCNESPDT